MPTDEEYLKRLKGLIPAPTAPTSGRDDPSLRRLFDASTLMRPQEQADKAEPPKFEMAQSTERPNAEPGRFGNYTVENARPEGLTGTRSSMADIRELENAPPREREKSIWKRLGSGLLDGLRIWAESGAPGGLGGALGAAATGGVGFAASPGAQADFQRKQQLQKLYGDYGRQNALETAEMERQGTLETAERERQGGILKQTKDTIGVQQADFDYRLSQAKPILDAIKQRGYANPGELEQIAAYGVNMTDPAMREYVEKTVAGKPYARGKYDKTYYPDHSLPDDPFKAPYDYQSPITKTRGVSTFGDILRTESPIAAADVAHERQIAIKNAENKFEADKTNATNLNNWMTANATLRMDTLSQAAQGLANVGELTGITKNMRSVAEQMQAYADQANDPDPTVSAAANENILVLQDKMGTLQQEFDTAMGKTQQGQTIVQQMLQQSIPKPGIVQAPAITPVTRRNPKSKGGRNERVGTVGDFQRAAERIKRLRGQ